MDLQPKSFKVSGSTGTLKARHVRRGLQPSGQQGAAPHTDMLYIYLHIRKWI